MPHPRVQADIADQSLGIRKTPDIADCRHQASCDDQIDTGDRQEALDGRIVDGGLRDLSVENRQILAESVEFAQMPVNGSCLVIGDTLLRQPDPA